MGSYLKVLPFLTLHSFNVTHFTSTFVFFILLEINLPQGLTVYNRILHMTFNFHTPHRDLTLLSALLVLLFHFFFSRHPFLYTVYKRILQVDFRQTIDFHQAPPHRDLTLLVLRVLLFHFFFTPPPPTPLVQKGCIPYINDYFKSTSDERLTSTKLRQRLSLMFIMNRESES
jgi:hypothetical protein